MVRNSQYRQSEAMAKLAFSLNPVKALGKLIANRVLRPAGRSAKDLAFGSTKASGPLQGTRLRWKHPDVAKLKGYKELSPSVLGKLSPEKMKRVHFLEIGGKKVPVMRKTTFGGVTGFAQRHPIVTGVGLLGANELRKSRNVYGPSAPQTELAMLQNQMQPYYQPLPPSSL